MKHLPQQARRKTLAGPVLPGGNAGDADRSPPAKLERARGQDRNHLRLFEQRPLSAQVKQRLRKEHIVGTTGVEVEDLAHQT